MSAKPLNEPLLVHTPGTRMGYLRPPKAFRNKYPSARIESMPEPTAFIKHRTEAGVTIVQLIYEWKEEELCQPNSK